MNSFNFMGKITQPRDGKAAIKISADKNNNLVASFALAVYDSYRKESDFFRCIAFGKQAEICERYMQGGTFVGVAGRIKNETIEDPDSGRRYYQQTFAIERITLPPKSHSPASGEHGSSGDNQGI